MSQKRKVIVTKDTDNFTESECDCHLCKDMNKTADSDFVPTTNVQKRLLAVIKKYDTSRPVKKRKRKE